MRGWLLSVARRRMYFDDARNCADSFRPIFVLVFAFFWALWSTHSGSVSTRVVR